MIHRWLLLSQVQLVRLNCNLVKWWKVSTAIQQLFLGHSNALQDFEIDLCSCYLLKQHVLFYYFYNNIRKIEKTNQSKKELLSVNADAASSNLPLIRIRMINLIRVTLLNICKFLTTCNIILLAAYSLYPWNMNLFCDIKELLSHYKNYLRRH